MVWLFYNSPFMGLVVHFGAEFLDAGMLLLAFENAFFQAAGAFAVLAPLLFDGGAAFGMAGLYRGFDGVKQPLAGNLAVHRLGTGVLDGH